MKYPTRVFLDRRQRRAPRHRRHSNRDDALAGLGLVAGADVPKVRRPSMPGAHRILKAVCYIVDPRCPRCYPLSLPYARTERARPRPNAFLQYRAASHVGLAISHQCHFTLKDARPRGGRALAFEGAGNRLEDRIDEQSSASIRASDHSTAGVIPAASTAVRRRSRRCPATARGVLLQHCEPSPQPRTNQSHSIAMPEKKTTARPEMPTCGNVKALVQGISGCRGATVSDRWRDIAASAESIWPRRLSPLVSLSAAQLLSADSPCRYQ
jgi:hypothetical protein